MSVLRLDSSGTDGITESRRYCFNMRMRRHNLHLNSRYSGYSPEIAVDFKKIMKRLLEE